jgi:hypothetical protein
MSRVLILNRYRLQSAAFHRWLDPRHELFLLNCATRAVEQHPEAAAIRERYVRIAEFEDYIANPSVLETGREWIREYGIDTVLAFSEYDVLRAARLRDEFGLAGQSEASALAYRDKLIMKERLVAAGLPTVPHAQLRDPGDLAAFAEEVGYPVIVKPRTGTGSKGIVQIFDASSAAAFEAEAGERLIGHLAEAFTPHELLHCDGIFVDGRAVFSEAWSWSTTMLEVQDQELPTLAIVLDPGDPRRAELLRLAERTLRALPTPRRTAFHIEFFATATGMLINEAASRVGGGRIQPTLRRLHGIDLVELAARYQVPSSPERLVARPTAANAGFLLVYDTQHAQGFAPVDGLPPGITHYESVLPPVRGAAQDLASTAYLLSGVAVGDSREHVSDQLLKFLTWFRAGRTTAPVSAF